MKKQNGFSQIFVMVVMLILAIALPVTANLVKKVQDNRSSALGTDDTGCATAGGECVSLPNNSTATSGSCTNSKGTGLIQVNLCMKRPYDHNYRCCISTAASAPAAETITCEGKAYLALYPDVANDAYYGTHPQVHYDLHDGARIWPANGCVGNDGTYSCATGNAVIVNCGGLGCSNGKCNAAPAAPAPVTETPTCEGQVYLALNPDVKNAGWPPRKHYDTVHASEPGRIWPTNGCIANDGSYSCDASLNPTIINCGGLGCSNGKCNAAPAPVAPCTPNCACADSTLVGQTCSNGCDGGTCAGTKPVPVTKWKVTGGSCNISTGNYLCSSGTDSSFTFGTQAECVASSGCDVIVCESGNKRCSGDNAQICRADGSDWTNTDCGTLGCNTTTKACNVCTPGAEQCSGTTSRVCKADGSGWTDTACGAIGCNANTKVCNVCTPGNQKCSTSNDYFTCTGSGTWTSTKTDCSSGQICTNGEIGACRTPEYAAPKINLLFAIFGVNSNATLPCLGDNKFTVTVYKDGVIGGIKTDNVLATAVSVNNSTVQVFKISDFQLSNNIALTDKIKISIGGRKTLAIIYGKNNQETGFPTTAASQILVSSLVTDHDLNLYKFPLLNGDIGSAGNIGVKDNVIDGIDFAHMSNQWNKRCTAGQNLESDLNGDCYVDGLDLQIYKKALEKQYSQ